MDTNTISEMSRLANTYGLGAVLAITNVLILTALIAWVLKTCHSEKMALAEIVNKSIESMSISLQQNTLATSQQTDLLKSLNQEVKERWEVVKDTGRYQREEHNAIIRATQEILMRLPITK